MSYDCLWLVRSIVHKFISIVDTNSFLAARSCLVADKNSCVLVLHSKFVIETGHGILNITIWYDSRKE